jgi:hypothetical protein
VTRLSANDAALVYSTYLGGNDQEYIDRGMGFAVDGTDGREEYGSTGIGLDAQGNVHVTGGSEFTDYPTVNPYQPSPHGRYDVVLTRIGAESGAEQNEAVGSAAECTSERRHDEQAVKSPGARFAGSCR